MITVTLTREELVARGACEGGLALFEEIAVLQGTAAVTVEWTPLASLWIAATHPNFAGWLYAEGLTPRADLSGADLSGADLTGADLTGADLSDAYRYSSDSAIPGWAVADGRLVRGAL